MGGRHLLLLSVFLLVAGTTLPMCVARANRALAVGVDKDYQHHVSIHKESSIFVKDYGGRDGGPYSGGPMPVH